MEEKPKPKKTKRATPKTKRPATPEPTVPADPSLFTPVAFAAASREMIEELTAPDVTPQSNVLPTDAVAGAQAAADEVVAAVRKSASPEDARNLLMSGGVPGLKALSETQARAVLALTLSRLTSLAANELKDEEADLTKELKVESRLQRSKLLKKVGGFRTYGVSGSLIGDEDFAAANFDESDAPPPPDSAPPPDDGEGKYDDDDDYGEEKYAHK